MYSHCEYTYSTTNQLTRKARIELVSPYITSSWSKWKTKPSSSGTKSKHETGHKKASMMKHLPTVSLYQGHHYKHMGE